MFLRNLIERLGANPQQSWANFKVGLIIFVVGAILLLLGAKYLIWLQIPAVICLAIGLGFAAKGYVGIFASRFYQSFSQLKPPSSEDK